MSINDITMPALHHEQHIGPVDHFLINTYAGLVVCAGRAGNVDRVVFK